MAVTIDKYVFGRDKKESERLNVQHNLLSKVTENTLIHPSIPTEGTLSIADIGTGTGIWLEDVSKVLEQTNSQGYYHGFDVSSAQFPETRDNIEFSVQDITSPFPKEHWNRYDIIHVRLLVAAISESDYRTAIANLSAILKPGGFLQWEEIDEETYISADNPVIQEIHRCFDYSLGMEGKCFRASAKVYAECNAAGFQDVQRLFYRSDANPDLRVDTDNRLAQIIGSLYARLLVRSGQVRDEEEASKRTTALVQQHLSLCAEGKSPPLTLMRVVAQKPLEG